MLLSLTSERVLRDYTLDEQSHVELIYYKLSDIEHMLKERAGSWKV